MQVDVAIDVVDKMCEAFCMPSSHVMQSLLETCSETNQDFQVLYILRKAASLLRKIWRLISWIQIEHYDVI
jgi:hypothetical protein